ncbi:GDSL-type esterase/lipase family protein [Streptacidiphilus cavernicola]|uniref:GDSL-type esterase/lipase family protein n=1 Tax=Streptacidiphilus cavernicola TaxID=3342716 RepID=A0ABV6VWW3_9ACTN
MRVSSWWGRGSSRGWARGLRWGRVGLVGVVLLALLCAVSIWLAVRITPVQSVSAAGQSIQVGAVQPDLSLSGPGELDLFGQAMPTRPRFDGPIRPRLKLAQITIDSQVNQMVGAGGRDSLELTVSRQLASGWIRYCVWETVIAAGCAAVIVIAAAGVRRAHGRTVLKLLAVGVVGVCAVNAVGVYLLASSTPRALRQVRSIDDLVGRTLAEPVPTEKGPALSGVKVVVLGDSTAAGLGNRPVAHATALDKACGRSADSYAADLAAVNGWNVLNLACQGATIGDGIVGVQIRGSQVAAPQLAVAQRATGAAAYIVSIGANDMNWSVLTGLCAAAPVCDDKASTAYFQEQLATFTQNYYDLLQQLATLPRHPAVLVNAYYEPFGPNTDCLKKEGLTTAKTAVLRSRLADVNTVLQQGAQTFHFASAMPDFTGHQLCSDQPYVQNTADQAPLHPTAAGDLAIALADQRALDTLPGFAGNPEPTSSASSAPSAPSAPSSAASPTGTSSP